MQSDGEVRRDGFRTVKGEWHNTHCSQFTHRLFIRREETVRDHQCLDDLDSVVMYEESSSDFTGQFFLPGW